MEGLKSEPEARFLGTKFSHRVTTLFRGNNFLSRSAETFKLLLFRIGVTVCVGKRLCSRCSTDKVTTKACSIRPAHEHINGNNTQRFASKIVHDNRFITRMKQSGFYALIV